MYVVYMQDTFIEKIYLILYIFWASGGGYSLYSEILQYYTMILQRIRIIAVDAGFEPGCLARYQ